MKDAMQKAMKLLKESLDSRCQHNSSERAATEFYCPDCGLHMVGEIIQSATKPS